MTDTDTTGTSSPRAGRTTVAVAFPEGAARASLVNELDQADDIEVVVELGSAERLFEHVHDVVPDVLLVSTELPGVDVTALCRRLATVLPICRVVLVFGPTSAPYEAVAAGAAGAVALTDLTSNGVWTVRRTVRGEALIPAQWAASILDDSTAPPLTPTEREVLQRLANGATPEAVAALHEVPLRLVHLHAGYAMAKIHRAAHDAAALLHGT
jgi:two-component system response regulator DesR